MKMHGTPREKSSLKGWITCVATILSLASTVNFAIAQGAKGLVYYEVSCEFPDVKAVAEQRVVMAIQKIKGHHVDTTGDKAETKLYFAIAPIRRKTEKDGEVADAWAVATLGFFKGAIIHYNNRVFATSSSEEELRKLIAEVLSKAK